MEETEIVEDPNKGVYATYGGIKCDNVRCYFIDPSVHPKDYLQWINKPCPDCGDNLLTEDDFDTFLTFMKVTQNLGINAEFSDKTLTDKTLISIDTHNGISFVHPPEKCTICGGGLTPKGKFCANCNYD